MQIRTISVYITYWIFAQPNLLICSKLTKRNKHPDILFVPYIWQLFPATLNFMPEMVHFDPNCTFMQPNLIIDSESFEGNKNKHTGKLLVRYIWQWCPKTLHFSLEMAIIPPFTRGKHFAESRHFGAGLVLLKWETSVEFLQFKKYAYVCIRKEGCSITYLA